MRERICLGLYQPFIKVPIELDADPVMLIINAGETEQVIPHVRLAVDHVDFWSAVRLEDSLRQDQPVYMTVSDTRRMDRAVILTREWPDIWEESAETCRPGFHFSCFRGGLIQILGIGWDNQIGRYLLEFSHDPLDNEGGARFHRRLISKDLIHWTPDTNDRETDGFRADEPKDNFWIGDISQTIEFRDKDGRTAQIALALLPEQEKLPYAGLLTLPAIRERGQLLPPEDIQKLRVWKREWEYIQLDQEFREKLRFSCLPGVWPEIRIGEAAGTTDDIGGELFEAELVLDTGQENWIKIEFCGFLMEWDSRRQALLCQGYRMTLPSESGILRFHIWTDRLSMEIFAGGNALFVCRRDNIQETLRVGNDLTENIYFDLDKETEHYLAIRTGGSTARIVSAAVYGLRGTELPPELKRRIRNAVPGKLIYKDEHYRIFENCVEDDNYGDPAAWVFGSETIISPVRLVEEFAWRKNPWGDMTRLVNRTAVWHPGYEQSEYPVFKTGIPVLDASYRLALDVFHDCVSPEYTLPGQRGMWTAGLFQGKGEGFGVWLRDSTHIGIRTGSLLDPEHARRTLRYTAGNGFDNGCDGPAMSAVGIWDYYLTTGDSTLIYDVWPFLLERIDEADRRFEENVSLVHAEQSTSNDAFPEPENGGFCLSTQIYYMLAYSAMARMGRLTGEAEEMLRHWRQRSDAMKESIRSMYWNETYGYFTSGPKGSEAYEKGYWETSGEEGAIWPGFGISTAEQRNRIFEDMPKRVMGEFGMDLFPDREQTNHYCHSVWEVYKAGFAAAAAERGDSEFLLRFVSQQLRNCIMNKTFHEVIDHSSGKCWRWPGQLWQAAGYLSCLIYGFLGLSYDEKGMRIHPAIPDCMNGISLKGLRYRKALLDIEVHGNGAAFIMMIDGECAEIIPTDITGSHQIQLKEKQTR